MQLTFYKIERSTGLPEKASNSVYLRSDNWDDYSFKTLFSVTVFDENGEIHDVGSVKIGFVDQPHGWSSEKISESFYSLDDGAFSVGQDADYYGYIVEKFSAPLLEAYLQGMKDVAFDANILAVAENENVFNHSLLRNVTRASIEHQFSRILNGDAVLTDYDFSFIREASDNFSSLKVDFKVKPNSTPPTNLHVLIGRNGVGKTTLLNQMVDVLSSHVFRPQNAKFVQENTFGGGVTDLENNFAGVISVSFSAFDPFDPPDDQNDLKKGMRYNYVGLKHRAQDTTSSLKGKEHLSEDFVKSLGLCLSLSSKRKRWLNAVCTLESDNNFAEMQLPNLVHEFSGSDTSAFKHRATKLFERMSSGHAVVLLTITRLVECVEEKTLVLLDEPESHLHPPLLSAFSRALSDLLINRNGVAIVATHSPVLLQEVPKSCVSIVRRTRAETSVERPENETFAENVGILTRDVFGLELTKSGFHKMLSDAVLSGKNYEEIEGDFDGKLGFEGRALLRSLIINRDERLSE